MKGIRIRDVLAAAVAIVAASATPSWPLAVLYGAIAATFVLVLARLFTWGR